MRYSRLPQPTITTGSEALGACPPVVAGMLTSAGLAASPFQGSQGSAVAAAAAAAHAAPLLGDQHRASQEAGAVEAAATLAAAAYPAWQGLNEEVLVGQCTLPGSRYG